MDFGRLLADPLMHAAVVQKNFRCLSFLNVLKTRGGYVNSGRLLADHILQHICSERSVPIREMHFPMFFCFVAF